MVRRGFHHSISVIGGRSIGGSRNRTSAVRRRWPAARSGTTKFDRMEPADQLAARISEASGFFPLDQLAISTQCGFASAGPGNQISEDAQENKLRLVGEVADRVWG
jgi:hypothetical protein